MVDNEHRFRRHFTKEVSTRFVYSNYAFNAFVREYLEEPTEEETDEIGRIYPYNTQMFFPC